MPIHCKTCPWFEKGRDTGHVDANLGREGLCLFKPPVAGLVPGAPPAIQRNPAPSYSYIGLIPTTFENRRCSEHPECKNAVPGISSFPARANA